MADRKEISGLSEDASGLRFEHIDQDEADFLYEEVFVRQCYTKGGIVLSDNDTVIDVGANIGLFSLWCCQQRQNVQVHAVEPIPRICETLRRNVAHPQNEGSITVHQLGLGATHSTASFTYLPDTPGESTRHMAEWNEQQCRLKAAAEAHRVRLLEAGAEGGDEKAVLLAALETQLALWQEEQQAGQVKGAEIVCEVSTLTRLVQHTGLKRVDLIKIDVEGDELAVLEGLDAATFRICRQVVLEVHDVDGRLAKVEGLLREQGFRVQTVAQAPDCHEGFLIYVPPEMAMHYVYAVRPAAVQDVTEPARKRPRQVGPERRPGA